MAADPASYFENTYTNPVYTHSFPDPYVLKFRGEYFAYCTGFWKDDKVFGILKSRDLVHWQEIGGAMQPLDNNSPFYWAPEVTYDNGKFYLYYSMGNEELMELRVAVSDNPFSGFIDSGKRLTTEDFAIDAHVFTDDDGKRYLFYATDFLHHTHIGTGTVVDEMIDPFTLAGNPRPVTRAKYDWQVYDPNRKEKGGVRWHTVEGPFVLKHKGFYYEMFSGGNWKNITYGVGFAITDNIESEHEWQQFCDSENVLPILRTIPDRVIGPGHNSVVRGPNNRELYCIYHRWAKDERVLAMDRMDFAGKRIFISGATYAHQIAPFPARHRDFFDAENFSQGWQKTGTWSLKDGQAISEISKRSELICQHDSNYFLCEFSLRCLDAPRENGGYGFRLRDQKGKNLDFLIFPNKKHVEITFFEKDKKKKQKFSLPAEFVFDVFHLLRIEINTYLIKITLGENVVRFERRLENNYSRISLQAVNTKAAFSGFELTDGFEDLFEVSRVRPEQIGWQKLTDSTAGHIEGQQFFLSSHDGAESIAAKGDLHKNYEFAANTRLVGSHDNKWSYGLLMLGNESEVISKFSIGREGIKVDFSSGAQQIEYSLPKGFIPEDYHQLRFLRIGEKVRLQMEDKLLGEITVAGEETKFAIFCQNSIVALDMVRLTVL
jgi:GH43 family beta-xylosidase